MSDARIKGCPGGILVVDKPSGLTSRAVVDRVVRLIGRVKVGHAGTLDPLASGVLVVCVGPATRLVEEIQSMPKSYRTIVRLDARSDTLDADGRIECVDGVRVPSIGDIQAALAPLVGEVDQVPPAYSALKLGGRRAYDLARGGQVVELVARRVRIDRIEVTRYEWPRLELAIDCGSGTYIRSIARDVGEALGCGGLVEVLVRTRIGPFRLEEAVTWDGLTAESVHGLLRSPVEAVAELPRLVLEPSQVAAAAAGRCIPIGPNEVEAQGPSPIALVDVDGGLIALAEIQPEAGRIQPRKVFVGQ